MPEDENELRNAHSSYIVWLVYYFRAIGKILPALKGKSKYGWVPAVAICLLVVLVSLAFGIYFDGYVIHPPTQYQGLCQPPAEIVKAGQNCVQVITTTITSGASTTVKTSSIQAGTIVNGTG